MSDDDTLRDRIAAVLSDRYDGFAAEWLNASWEEVADAIIRELPELQPCPFCGLSHNECGCLRKDVTDWKATE